MQLKSLTLLFAVLSVALGDSQFLPQSACDFCQTIVPRISDFVAAGVAEADIITKLNLGCAELAEISTEYRAKCDGFVGVYADYIIDMITATTNTGEFCKSFGLCNSDLNEPEYTVLFPTIYENNVTYAIQTDTPAMSYKYKIFLGNSTELFNSHMVSLSYALSFDQEGQKVIIKIQNEAHIMNMLTCHMDSPCTLETINPGDGVWYFIDIETEDANPFRINFNATEQRWSAHTTFIMSRRHGLSLISFMLIVSTAGAILCLCISCCLRLKKGKLERSRRCRTVNVEQGFPQFVPQFVPEFEMQHSVPMGYYYFPDQQPNQMELEVPQDFWAPVPPQPQPQAPTFDQM